MCGRYASRTTPGELAHLYDVPSDGAKAHDLGERYNVAPTDQIYAVLDRTDPENPGETRRELHDVRWGLVPSWSRDPSIGTRAINARIETLGQKPMFRKAFQQRRCIIPADGYYEWVQRIDEAGRKYKQPFWLHPAANTGPLSFAGLYEFWPDPSKPEDAPDRWLWSATIITCAATGPAGEVHDRTPFVIPDDRIDAWLDPRMKDPDEIAPVMARVQPPLLGVREVSTRVNKVGNEGPELIVPLSEAEPVVQLRRAA
ncbi:putative SOS response-associated peptidase YedK [Nocardioides sp. BE266]|uniref:SOS response-associated peptidase n=1 Tax=Nocardioides sp. BE266 TaxID=2817725 RepID=UPI002864E27F|nr:SOS response-associated peptidase [Nocardioides sp. BE266]MDR7255051.1 putative SOS response-associated peptidase YedK [Nocardioides sp. BE266]